MALVWTLVLAAVALTALCWAVALAVQGALYNQPASRLPLRAVVAGLALSCYLAGWTYANTRASHRDKYGTLFELNPTARKPLQSFDAVRRLAVKDAQGNPREETVPFRVRTDGGPNTGKMVEAATQQPFRRGSSAYITVALLVPDGKGVARFAAPLADGRFVLENGRSLVYAEEGGARTISDEQPEAVSVPDPGALAAGVALNLGVFAAWFLAFWLVMQCNSGHALALTTLFAPTTLFVLMPMLFRLNAAPPA